MRGVHAVSSTSNGCKYRRVSCTLRQVVSLSRSLIGWGKSTMRVVEESLWSGSGTDILRLMFRQQVGTNSAGGERAAVVPRVFRKPRTRQRSHLLWMQTLAGCAQIQTPSHHRLRKTPPHWARPYTKEGQFSTRHYEVNDTIHSVTIVSSGASSSSSSSAASVVVYGVVTPSYEGTRSCQTC